MIKITSGYFPVLKFSNKFESAPDTEGATRVWRHCLSPKLGHPSKCELQISPGTVSSIICDVHSRTL